VVGGQEQGVEEAAKLVDGQRDQTGRVGEVSRSIAVATRKPKPDERHVLRRVEQACTDLLDSGEQITFTALATKTSVARTTLDRNQPLRAVIDDHRTRQTEARTPSGLTSQIAHLRRHEEQLRKLQQRRANSA
jgi:hypothetical protein